MTSPIVNHATGKPGPAPAARLPFESIATLFAFDSNEAERCQWNFRSYGIKSGEFYRCARKGLTVKKAEDWCDALGVHPVEIWGDAYYAAAGIDVEAVAA